MPTIVLCTLIINFIECSSVYVAARNDHFYVIQNLYRILTIS